jgi:PDZ domain-containing protein
VLLAVIGGALLVVAVLQHVKTSEYALTPGDATSVAPLVKVEGLATDPHRDRIMLTDVYLSSLSAWQWIVMHFQSHVEFVNSSELFNPGIPSDELAPQGFLEMSDSKQAAEVAALRALGWTLRATPVGAVVNGVVAPSPARRAGVHVADRIVSVNGANISSTCALIAVAHDLGPGSVVHLGVERAHISSKGVITWSSPKSLALTTSPPPSSGLGSSGCPGITGKVRSWLGVSLEDGVNFALPGTIDINTSYIGGPSAGLAMTLALIDRLSSGSLTGHWVVAATGTIDVHGNVGDVGGVAEKTVAVAHAGARIFLVPKVEVATAVAAAPPGLRVIGVSTLREALFDLRGLGGAAPVPLTKPR